MTKAVALKSVRKALDEHGLLLQADSKLKSIAGIVAGDPIKGSWWGHPAGKVIFNVCSDLADDPDILVMRLVAGKVTFVHRRLWPAVVAVATADADWQRAKLRDASKALLAAIVKAGELPSNQLPAAVSERVSKVGDVVRDLESRLLIVTEEVHTESGAHAKILRSWQHWAKAKGVKDRPSVRNAEKTLELAAAALGSGSKVRLPWKA